MAAGRNAPTYLEVADEVLIRESSGHGVYGSTGNQGSITVDGCGHFRFENLGREEFGGELPCP